MSAPARDAEWMKRSKEEKKGQGMHQCMWVWACISACECEHAYIYICVCVVWCGGCEDGCQRDLQRLREYRVQEGWRQSFHINPLSSVIFSDIYVYKVLPILSYLHSTFSFLFSFSFLSLFLSPPGILSSSIHSFRKQSRYTLDNYSRWIIIWCA